jgi:hypothetical protein
MPKIVLDTPAAKPPAPKPLPKVVTPQNFQQSGFSTFKSTPLPQAAPAAAKPPVASNPQAQFNNSLLGGGGGGAAPASATDSTDYLNGDAQYQLQLASLMKALNDEQTDVTNQQTQYNNDYETAVKNLGWEQPDPTNAADQGQWNFGDTNTAAGRAFNNQQNDFAGRGLLQSSAYGTANDNLTRSLNDQLASTNTAKTNFLNGLTQQQNSFKTDNQQQQQQARIDALNRMAAGVSPVAV